MSVVSAANTCMSERVSSVVHVVAAGEVGGAERMLVDLAKSQHGRSHSVALFTPNDALRRLFRSADIAVDDRGPVREGPLSYLASTLGPTDVRWLTGVLARRKATIVHLHTFASQVLGARAARAVGARIVRTEHSTRVYDDPSCWPFSRWSLRRAHAVVCISEHVRKAAIARAGRDLARPHVIYNGVDTDHFAPRPTAHSNGDRTTFLALGRLDRRKGVDIALEAIARTPKAELDVVGDGEERSSLEALAARLNIRDRVRFYGHAVDVRDAIAKADVILSTARQEGLGIALLEAMAMARPVVAFPTGGIPEIVDAHRTGWLTAEPTIDALTPMMNAAMAESVERERRGAAARTHVIERFSLTAMRTSYEAIYAGLIV